MLSVLMPTLLLNATPATAPVSRSANAGPPELPAGGNEERMEGDGLRSMALFLFFLFNEGGGEGLVDSRGSRQGLTAVIDQRDS